MASPTGGASQLADSRRSGVPVPASGPRPSLASATPGCRLRWELWRCLPPGRGVGFQELWTLWVPRGRWFPGSRGACGEQGVQMTSLSLWGCYPVRDTTSGSLGRYLESSSGTSGRAGCQHLPGMWRGSFPNCQTVKLPRSEGTRAEDAERSGDLG